MMRKKRLFKNPVFRKKPKIEILSKDNEGNIELARALLEFRIPLMDRKFGTWSYFLRSKDGVVIFDTGMRFKTPSLLFRGRKKPYICRRTRNAEKIMYALSKLFPEKPVKEIILSHFHQDHSEEAPSIQQYAGKYFGIIPPIRIHRNEMKKRKLMHFGEANIESIIRDAGYDSWLMGRHVKDGDKIEGTDFSVAHLPGHTEGFIGLVNKKEKIAILGSWYTQKDTESMFVDLAFNAINENLDKLYKSIEKISEKYKDYKLYFIHPRFKENRKIFFKKRVRNENL